MLEWSRPFNYVSAYVKAVLRGNFPCALSVSTCLMRNHKVKCTPQVLLIYALDHRQLIVDWEQRDKSQDVVQLTKSR